MKMLGIKLLLLLLGLGIVAPMFILGPDGEPIMSLDDWIPHTLISRSQEVINGLEDLTDRADDLPSDIGLAIRSADYSSKDELSTGTAVFTWRDENGVLHYSDTPIEGATVAVIADDALAIPATRFMQSGLSPAESTPSARNTDSRAVLLEERDYSNDSNSDANFEDIEALANGDFSKLGSVLKNLPQWVEQAKQARQKTSTD
ncbi:MAG: DUF4124 domain-containing protein [Pseudomonadales bacterium]|nr:DUF4124 domain-containing protein [Pseudomonadales bacterium]